MSAIHISFNTLSLVYQHSDYMLTWWLPEGADQRANFAETKGMMLGERMAASYVASRYLWVIREYVDSTK